MSAPEGNNFWTKRHKDGRDMLFASPEALWLAACEYFKHVEDNPFMESKAMVVSNGGEAGSSIEISETPKIKPYTMTGLCLYLHCSESYFRNFKATQEDKRQDFMTVIEHIKQTIYNQKFSGAASGFFNGNIISRDLGLKDHSDVTTKGKEINQAPSQIVVYSGAPPLPDAEAKIEDEKVNPPATTDTRETHDE